jgi:cell division protein ZapD
LFDRLVQLLPRDSALDHHFALVTLFEIMDVASRADLKSDLLKELERHKSTLIGYRGNPHVAQNTLEQVIAGIEQSYGSLNQLAGKAGQALANNEWLMSVRSRISIPGGTCEFDLPAYYAWQQLEAPRRRSDLAQWASTMIPLGDALRLLLKLLREAGAPHRVLAQGGQYQQSLPPGRSYQLMRVRMEGDVEVVPEITGHRLMVSIRLMRADAEGRLRPFNVDTTLDLTLCA